jgi:hypothetical protein
MAEAGSGGRALDGHDPEVAPPAIRFAKKLPAYIHRFLTLKPDDRTTQQSLYQSFLSEIFRARTVSR